MGRYRSLLKFSKVKKGFIKLKYQNILQEGKTRGKSVPHTPHCISKRCEAPSSEKDQSWELRAGRTSKTSNLLRSNSQSWAWGLLGLMALTLYHWNKCFGSFLSFFCCLAGLLQISGVDYTHHSIGFPSSCAVQSNDCAYTSFTTFILLQNRASYSTSYTHSSLPDSTALTHCWEPTLKVSPFQVYPTNPFSRRKGTQQLCSPSQ